jgi:hypothetical protein
LQGQGPGAHNTQLVSTRKIWPSTSQNSSKICGHLSSMFLSKGLTCYTDVESNGRDASYQNPNRLPNVCDSRQETRMHAQMTVSPSPMLPKVSPARFDIHPYRLDNGHGSSNFASNRRRTERPHTRFQRVQDRSSTSQNLQNLRPPPDVPSKGLTCYTDVGAAMVETPHTKTQTGCQTCDLQARDTHARR